MKKIRTNIKTSPSRDLLFDVYRAEVATDLPATTTALAALTPVMTVDESKIVSKAHFVQDEVIGLDITSIISGDFMPYSIKHGMLRDILHGIKVKIKMNDNSVKMYDIVFNTIGGIDSVKDEVGSSYSPSDTFDVVSANVLKIKQSLLTNSVEVKASYYTEVIEVIDLDDPQTGVTYVGPPPLGFPKADILKRDKMYTAAATALVPYYEFEAHMVPGGETYFYRVLARDAVGNISDPSDELSIALQQSDLDVEYILQYCMDTSVTEPVWLDTPNKLANGDIISYGKPGSTGFASQGTIFVSTAPKNLASSGISAVTHTTPTADVTLTVPNAWKSDTYKSRKTKAFRLKGYLKSHNTVYDLSDVIAQALFNVGIDTVVVRRKEVADPSTDTTPATLTGTDSITVASFVKRDGVTYNSIQSATPADIDLTTQDTATFQTGMKHSIMTDSSGLSSCTIKDTNVAPGKIYRYTVYVKDDLGQVSTGVSYDVHN